MTNSLYYVVNGSRDGLLIYLSNALLAITSVYFRYKLLCFPLKPASRINTSPRRPSIVQLTTMFFSQAAIGLFAAGIVAAAPAVEKRAAITDGN